MGEGLVPKLRFPEFQDAPAWEPRTLEELEQCGLLELGRGEVISARDMAETPGPFPVYSSSVKNDGYMGSYGRYMFDEELISWSVDGGGNFFYRPKHKFSVTNVSGYIRLKTERLGYRFFAAQLQFLHGAHTFDYQLKAHPSVIRKLYCLGIPSPAEQRKVAECLTSLDDLIAAEGRRLEALRKWKKALLQNLFPREGETTPRLRFPEFHNAGEWESTPLESILTVRDDRRPPSEIAPLYSLTIESGITPKSGRYDREFLVRDSAKKYKVVKPYDVVYNPANLRWGAIAVSHLAHDVVVSPIYEVLFVSGPERHHPRFVQCAITREEQIKVFAIKGQGTLLERIVVKIGDFLTTTIQMPPLPAEQQRIASCLGSLDTLITEQTKKLDTLKTHKQGLMQGLFPSTVQTG